MTSLAVGDVPAQSRSISNLGSSFGTAVAGTILVAGLADPKRSYGIAMVVVAFFGLIGLAAAMMLPRGEPSPEAGATSFTVEQPG